MSPFEAKYRRRFDYRLLKKFGCNGYIHMGYELEKGEKDLSPKSQLGIYIGITYPVFQGWLFYMPDSHRIGRIYVGIDVTWNEVIPLNESTYFEPLESILNVLSTPRSKQITDFEYLIGLTHIGIGIYVSFADPRGPILILVYVDDLLIAQELPNTIRCNHEETVVAI
jgi:hypothetical protein